MASLSVNGIRIGFYPDEGDAGGTKSYLSDLNSALVSSWPQHAPSAAPLITVVGWYAQTYPGEEFTGFQFMPLVDDITNEYTRCARAPTMVYEASVMPFQSWTGYTPDNNAKAKQVAQVMKAMLDRSKVQTGEFAIAEIRLRFGHEVNYYIKSGLYPPPTDAHDPGKDFRLAFDQVAMACRALAEPYRDRIKLFWCPNIASTSNGALAEYETFLPTLSLIDYVGIDYYCPAPGCLNAPDFVRKMKKLHDKYCSATRPFVLGETGLHFDDNEGGGIHAKLRWLDVVTGSEASKALPWMVGVSWFNYEKDRDYRLLWAKQEHFHHNAPFVDWVTTEMEKQRTKGQEQGKGGGKVKKFWKTLLAN